MGRHTAAVGVVIGLYLLYGALGLGIQLSLPLYAGGGIGAGVRQSVAEREAASHQLLDARRSAALSTESAFISLESSLEQIAAFAEALAAVQMAEESARRGLELGQRTTLDWLNVQRERYQIERNFAAARYQYMLAYLQLRASVGEPLGEAIETVNRLLPANKPHGEACRQNTWTETIRKQVFFRGSRIS